MHRALRRLDREPIHHLQRAGHEPRADDVRDRLAGLAGVLEERDERARGLGLRYDAKDDPKLPGAAELIGGNGVGLNDAPIVRAQVQLGLLGSGFAYMRARYRRSRSVMLVATPSVPSDPTNAPSRS